MKTMKLFAGFFALFALVLAGITFAAPAGIVIGTTIIAGLSANALKEKRSELETELMGIINLAKEEKREFSETENTRREEIRKEIEKLDSQIEQAVFEEKVAARAAGRVINEENERREMEETEGYSLTRALYKTMRGEKLDGLEGEMQEEARKEMAKFGQTPEGMLQVPSMVLNRRNRRSMAEKRAALAAGTANAGAEFVQTDVTDFIGSLYDKNVLRGLGAKMITGLTGNMSIPTGDVATAEWEGENDDNADGTPGTDSITASPKRLGAYGTVSKQLLLQQGNYDVDKFVEEEIVKAINQSLQIAAINGSGAGNIPEGILNKDGIGSVVGGTNGLAPTANHLIDLETAIANMKADVDTMAFLTNPRVRGKLKKTKLDEGSGQFVWDFRSNNELMGYKAAVTTGVPSNLTKGTSEEVCSAIIFGDFSSLVHLQWGGLDVVLDHITKAKKSQVEIVINSFWDILIRRAKAFAAMKDALTA